jgi:hypothetical protein
MPRACVVVLLLTGAAGCGLSDYEKRMDEQRERLKLFDEEAALLYDIIDMPKGKDAYGNEIKVPFEVMLRLPIRFSGKFEGPKAVYSAEKLPLYRFSSDKPDVNVLVAWALAADKNAKAAPKADEVLPEDFRNRVRGALQVYITRTYSVSANIPDFNQLKKDPRQVVRDGRPRTLDFESTSFDDPRQNRYMVYFETWPDRQAAVIYQVPVQQIGQYQRAMDVSLKTLEITGIAAAKREEFRSRPR